MLDDACLSWGFSPLGKLLFSWVKNINYSYYKRTRGHIEIINGAQILSAEHAENEII